MFNSDDRIHAHSDDAPIRVYLEILQAFGPRLTRPKKDHVNILLPGERTAARCLTKSHRQIVVLLKELSQETYKCLQDPDDVNSTSIDVRNSRKCRATEQFSGFPRRQRDRSHGPL